MIMGHYASALIPYGKEKDAPFWLLLVCAQFGDFLWFLLAALGISPILPASFVDASLLGIRSDLLYSHSLLYGLAQSVLVGGVVFAIYKRPRLAAWCAALVAAHLLEDLLCGWKHELAGAGSTKVGLGLYGAAPGVYLAFILEALFSGLCVAWYLQQRRAQGTPIGRKWQLALYGVFVGGSFLFVANAEQSMRQLWHRLAG